MSINPALLAATAFGAPQLDLPKTLTLPKPEVVDPATRPPLWMDVALEYDKPLPGLPDFVTPAWFRIHANLTTTNLRRLRQGIDKRRRADPSFLAWWPDGFQPSQEDFFWFAARAGIDKRESVAFSSVVRRECRPAVLRNASLFENLIVAYKDGRNQGTSAYRKDATFASVYEKGAETAALILGVFMENDTDGVSRETAALIGWYADRFPECFEDADRIAAARRAAKIAADTSPLPIPVEPVAEPEPLDPVEEHRLLGEALTALTAAEEERDAYAEDLDDLNTRHAALQRELAAVRAGYDPRLVEAVEAGTLLPTTVEELVHWIETRISPEVHVLPRAFRSLRKAPGFDVERVARGLLFLKDVYVPYRSERGISYRVYREAMVEAGYDETASFASNSSIEAFPEYKAVWNGRTISLDRHLKRGVGTDARTMIRIYFHWDRSTGTVVVGHMPGHLDNWKKN